MLLDLCVWLLVGEISDLHTLIHHPFKVLAVFNVFNILLIIFCKLSLLLLFVRLLLLFVILNPLSEVLEELVDLQLSLLVLGLNFSLRFLYEGVLL